MRGTSDADLAHSDQSGLGEGLTLRDEFDFRLPHLNISRATPSSSTTDEPLIQGLFGILQFVEWDDFEDKMDTILKSSADIPARHREKAQRRFDICREDVNETYDSTTSPIPKDASSFPACFAHTPVFDGQDCRKHYDTSTSVDVDSALFKALCELLTGLHAPKYTFEYPMKQFFLLGIPRVPRFRRPIPDRALCTVTMSRPDVPPLCTFEMKGPAESFSHHVKSCCSRLLEISPTCSEDRKRAIVNEICDGPRCPHEMSARGLCLYFNSLFTAIPSDSGNNQASANYLGSKTDVDMVKKIRMMIAQTLIQALTCSSGCGFLFTYETGVAFELAEFAEQHIVVRTSPLFCCGNQKGTAAAVLTLSDHALKKLSEDKLSTSRVETFARKIAAASGHRSGAQKGPSETSIQLGSSSICPIQQGNTASSNAVSRAAGVDATDMIVHSDNASRSCSVEFHRADGSKRKRSSSALSEAFSTPSDVSDITEDAAGAYTDDAERFLDLVYREKQRMLHSGSSGTVFEAFWEERRLALKLWSGEREEGLIELCREVAVYEFIKATAPSLLGVAVPESVLTLNTVNRDGLPHATVAVVTEYVGEGLSRDSAGKLWRKDKDRIRSIGRNDEREICRAALSALTCLHLKKVLHGDIALRNLRVELDSGVGVWKVWWIDFGRASFGEEFTQSGTTAEIYHCALLFENMTELITEIETQ